jgi:hypothetical protein
VLINFFLFNETHPPTPRYQRRATLTPSSCARVGQPPSKNVASTPPPTAVTHTVVHCLIGEGLLTRALESTTHHSSNSRLDFAHPFRDSISLINFATRFRSSISRLDFAHPFRDSTSLIHFATRFCSSISRLNFSHPFRDSFCLSISGPSGALTIEPSDEILLAIANRVQSSSLAGESPLEISRLGDSPKSKPMEGSFSHLRHKHKCTARITVQRKYHFCPCLRPKARSSNIPVTRKTKGELQNKVTMHSYDA